MSPFAPIFILAFTSKPIPFIPCPRHVTLASLYCFTYLCRLAESELADESKRLRSAMDVTGTQKFRVLQEQRRRLPAFQERKQVLQSLHSHDVLVISGSTGETTTFTIFLILWDNDCSTLFFNAVTILGLATSTK